MFTLAIFFAMALPCFLDAAPLASKGAGRALSEDDACGPTAEGTCAVSALQTQRTAATSREGRAAAAAATATSWKQGEHRAAKGESAAQAPEETDEEAVKREWVYDTKDIWSNWEHPYMFEWENISVSDTPKWNAAFKLSAPMANQFCPKWVSYYWPKVSFLSQEVRRRVQALPDDLAPQQREQLRNFTHFAGWLMCAGTLDPRRNSSYGASTARYLRKLADLPSTSLEIPTMNDDPHLVANWEHFTAPDSCTIWSIGTICDNGYLSESLMGNKAGGVELCWDKVDFPSYAFSPLLFLPSFDKTRPKRLMNRAEHNHPEYLACQEKPLTNAHLDEYCPMHGKYPDGFWGQNWGRPPARGSEAYNDILQCQRKIGMPDPEFPKCRPPGGKDAVDLGLVDAPAAAPSSA